MILAQSHRQLLNGSKLILVLLIIFSFGSCGLFKNLGGKSISDQTNQENSKSSQVDTLVLTEIPRQEFPPIMEEKVEVENEDPFAKEKKENYKIALFIPFNADETRLENSEEEAANLRFINYYAGVKLALEEAKSETSSFEVDVFDSERSVDLVSQKIRSRELDDVDLIIGPYDRDGLKSVAEFGKEKKIPVFSPWLASTRITDNNPYYVQLRPSLSSHYFKLIEHANSNFNQDEIVLIGRDNRSDKNRFRYFQKAYAAFHFSSEQDLLEEYYVQEDSLIYGDTAFDGLFSEGGRKAVIIPNWNYNDEDFIYACLRKLNVEKADSEVFVYGMPIVYDSEKIDFDYYLNLNIRMCLSEFVDWTDPPVREFERKYYDQYGALPSSDAFEGYDMMKFTTRNMLRYGVNFHLQLETDNSRYLQTSYDIQPVLPDGVETVKGLKYLENKHLDLIQFIDDRFAKID